MLCPSLTTSITTHCKRKILMDIKFMLSRYKKFVSFEKICFRHFLNFQPNVVFNSQLLNSFMSREIRVEGIGQYEQWIGIGRCNARLSKREFCLVTCLKFKLLSNILNEEYEAVDGGIHHIYFDKMIY